ncbi:hypothetical protein NDU88_001853 [Pleurodeles waltl]|uniref:Uncharacterized protein n=1 Tax=Pleurodeles waltl TaxID=8319 RepID=A0AAV7P510_PLEWA|nr:hypothetical protein NDU88_001853 [Pleurodeles waltl]
MASTQRRLTLDRLARSRWRAVLQDVKRSRWPRFWRRASHTGSQIRGGVGDHRHKALLGAPSAVKPSFNNDGLPNKTARPTTLMHSTAAGCHLEED